MIQWLSSNYSIFLFIFTLVSVVFSTPIALSQSDHDRDISGVSVEDHTAEICRENRVVDKELTHEGYTIKLSRASDHDCHLIDIEKDGKLLFHDEEVGGHFFFGTDVEEDNKPFIHFPGEDDTKFVMSKWTGGAHCCFSLRIFSLGSEFKEIANVDGGNYQPYFEDMDRDGIPEIRVGDDALAYLFSSFAFSAIAEVVLKYTNSRYRVASDLMKKPVLKRDDFEEKIEEWQIKIKEHSDPDWPPYDLIQAITDLVYTGNKVIALDLIERVWLPGVPGKEQFMHKYEDALRESRFYLEFEKQL